MRASPRYPAFSWVPLALVSTLGALTVGCVFAQYAFEDAYITLRYAQNFGAGSGYAFNTGEHVLGTSSPLWTLALSAAAHFGANLEVAKTVLSGLSLGALAFAGGLVLRRERAPLAALGFALAVVFGFARSLESWGMETPLFMALVFASVEFLRARFVLIAGIAMGLAVLTRHEGALFALTMTLYLVAQEAAGWRRALRFSLGLLGSTAPWFLFAYSTFGTIVPHTLQAKSGSFQPLEYLVASVGEFPMEWFWSANWASIRWVRLVLSLGIGTLTLLGFRSLWIQRSPMLPIALGAGLILGGLCVINPGYFFRWHRLPLHYTLLSTALLGASRVALTFRFRCTPKLKTGARAGIAMALLGLPFALRSYREDLVSSGSYQSRVAVYDEVIAFVGKAKLGHMTLLTAEPGYVAYHTGNPVIDAAGLVSPNVSFGSSHRPCTTLPELLARQPGLILARAPFQPPDYRVLLDLDHRCRLLMRSDLWRSFTWPAGFGPTSD